MSKNLRKCMKTMRILCETKSKKIKTSILDEMCKQDCFFDALYEIVNNIYLKHIQFSSNQKRRLKKHIKLMECIHEHPKNPTKRKKIVKQTVGFLNLILPILLPVVGELISNVIRKKSNADTS